MTEKSDPLRKYGFLVVLFLAVWLSSPLRIEIFLIIFGFVVGFFSKNTNLPELKLGDIPQFPKKAIKSTYSQLPPQIRKSLNRLMDRVISQFIDSWYVQINKSESNDLQVAVRSCMQRVFCNLKKYFEGTDLPTLCTYGFTNAWIIHLVLTFDS